MGKRHDGNTGSVPVRRERAPHFTAHQLAVFLAVAEASSYTRAAERLGLSQPAVSQQIRALEAALGLTLVARQGRGIVLTPAGQELRTHAERLLTLLHGTGAMMREIHALQRGAVRIGASTGAGTYLVPRLLGAFHARYPGITVTLMVGNRTSVEEQLLASVVDLAVTSPIAQRDRITADTLMPYELIVVAPPSHRLARVTDIPLAALTGETFLLREQGSGMRWEAEQHFIAAGVPPPAGLELGSIAAIKEGAMAGLGVAVVSRESVRREVAHGDLVILAVRGFPLARQWYLAYARTRRLSRAAVALRHFLLHSAEDGR